MQTSKFQINESHLGTEATPEEAIRLAEILTKRGYESEYNSTQGVTTGYQDDNGNAVNIPDSEWDAALAVMLTEAI